MTRNFFQTVSESLANGSPGVLATIASTHGSTPAPVLSRLFVTGAAEVLGTVGGGCLEAEVLREAQKVRAAGGWARVAFQLTESEEELRMVCGGTVEILIERIEAEEADLFARIARRSGEGLAVLFARAFRDGGPPPLGARDGGPGEGRARASGTRAPARALLAEDGERLWGASELSREALDLALRAAREERAVWAATGAFYLEPVAARPRLLLVGAGHVSRAIHAIAAAAGFQTTVIDDREKYVAEERFPGATRIAVPGFEGLAEHVVVRPQDFVVLATRGHQFDEEALEQILRLPPVRYLGVIGSRRKHELAAKNLIGRGIPPERFAALHAPIGLDIGAVTPDEIAVAVVAEMIAVKRGAGSGGSRPTARPLAETRGMRAGSGAPAPREERA
jgi:xanthine dehydrogenase accessory factor